jgi:hypothetical protein
MSKKIWIDKYTLEVARYAEDPKPETLQEILNEQQVGQAQVKLTCVEQLGVPLFGAQETAKWVDVNKLAPKVELIDAEGMFYRIRALWTLALARIDQRGRGAYSDTEWPKIRAAAYTLMEPLALQLAEPFNPQVTAYQIHRRFLNAAQGVPMSPARRETPSGALALRALGEFVGFLKNIDTTPTRWAKTAGGVRFAQVYLEVGNFFEGTLVHALRVVTTSLDASTTYVLDDYEYSTHPKDQLYAGPQLMLLFPSSVRKIG